MTTERAFEMMARVLPDVTSITDDAEVIDVQKWIEKNDKKVPTAQAMKKLMPLILTKHRESFFRVAAEFKGVSVEELKAQPWSETLNAFKDGYGDMMLFFGLCLRMAMSA